MLEIVMPKLGSAPVGVLLSWKVSVGDVVEAGDIVAEIDAEKVTTEVESPARGRVFRLLASIDDEVPVGEPIALLEPMDAI
jgi:pyruvate/2-oxoglutarate dehydrogenase complex dihydrolipoamide acyltransferase (E2) component